MPSEQPREGTRVGSQACRCNSSEPHLEDCPVNPSYEPAQPEQPRGEGDAGKTRGYTREDIQANTWWPGKGGEGGGLAARLEARADNADKMAAEVARNPSNYGESGPRHHARLLAAAYAFRKAAEMARASTHPEQSERVDLEWAFRLMRDCLQAGKEPEDDEQDRLDDIADAMIRPAQTEQGGEGEVS